MASMMERFGFFLGTTKLNCEMPEIYPFPLLCEKFIDADLFSIYTKVLVDCTDRTQGLTDEVLETFWDNCLQNETKYGLISMLALAMTKQADLYLIYKSDINVLRVATPAEQLQIKADYAKAGKSSVGVYVSFKEYRKTELLKVYGELEYAVLTSLHKSMNIAKSIQYKVNKLRESVGKGDSTIAIDQAKDVAQALGLGRDVMLDGEDEIVTPTVDMDPTEKAIGFLDAKRCFYLNLPLSYVTGEQTGGIGSTGEADARAVERGLRGYYNSILKPVILALYGIKTTFKSNDFRQLSSALEAAKTFELISDNLISLESKRLIVATLLDLEPVKGEVVNDSSGSEQNATEARAEDQGQAAG